jgi:hypothetical protein
MNARTAVLLLLASSLLSAAGLDDWANVEKLAPGRGVVVVLSNGKRLEGPLRTAGPSGLTVDTASGPTDVQKSDVFRVSTLGRRQRNVLLGTAIAAAAGAVLGSLGRTYLNNESGNGDAFLAGSLAVGAGAGAGLGLAASVPQTIYRAVKP